MNTQEGETPANSPERVLYQEIYDQGLLPSGHSGIVILAGEGAQRDSFYVVDGDYAEGPVAEIAEALALREEITARVTGEGYPIRYPNIKDLLQDPAFQEAVVEAGRLLQNVIHSLARVVGHWDDLESGKFIRECLTPAGCDDMVAKKLLLCHSEISEGVEGFRCDLMDDKIPDRPMLEVELVDLVKRAFDIGGFQGYDLGEIILRKAVVNANRPDHTPEERRKKGGKKF